MLVLSRTVGTSLLIGPDIVVTLVSISGNTARIGITAPDSYLILREELVIGDTQDANSQD